MFRFGSHVPFSFFCSPSCSSKFFAQINRTLGESKFDLKRQIFRREKSTSTTTPTSSQMRSTVMSGIQPSGSIHLGNYLGAITNWREMQNEYDEVFYSIVDLHSLTSSRTEISIREQTIESAATLIACGIDPKKCALFPQSCVFGHTELAWFLSCISPVSWLTNMIQYKEKRGSLFFSCLPPNIPCEIQNTISLFIKKSWPQTCEIVHKIELILFVLETYFCKETDVLNEEEGKHGGTMGLLSYPVLMTSDILLYRATHVPVGEDQRQHLELARDIAETFNSRYKTKFFSLPISIQTSHTRVMSLTNPQNKMSKSDQTLRGCLYLRDSPDEVAVKIKKAKTDGIGHVTSDLDNRPEVHNLVRIFAALSGADLSEEQVVEKYTSKSIVDFKKDLTELIIGHTTPIRQQIERLLKDQHEIEKVLANGSEKATEQARTTIQSVKEIMGLFQFEK